MGAAVTVRIRNRETPLPRVPASLALARVALALCTVLVGPVLPLSPPNAKRGRDAGLYLTQTQH